MDQNQVNILRETFIRELEEESKTTLRVLKAAAQGNKDYRPDPNAKSAFELAWHIASTDCWFADSICRGAFTGSDGQELPQGVNNNSAIAEWYTKNFAACVERLKSLSPEALNKPIDFFGIATLPAVMFLAWLRSHSIHHRGQLSTYLRPMGSKVPSIYGGSYDQPMQ